MPGLQKTNRSSCSLRCTSRLNSGMLENMLRSYLMNSPIKIGKSFIYNSICKKIESEEKVITTKDGFKLLLNPNDPCQKYIFWYSRYNENDEVQLAKSLLNENDCFIDVGAHIGYFSLTAAHKVGYGGKVFSFEPNPYTYKLLERNVQVNSYNNIELHKEAVADSQGATFFYFKEATADYGASLHRTDKHNSVHEVKKTTLDSFCAERNISPAFIKIDAERADNEVILGAKGLLSAKSTPPPHF